MMYLLISNIVYAILLFLAFVKGIEIGNKVKVGEKPIRTIKEYIEDKQEEKREEEAQRKARIVAENIERYDGTGKGQQKVK